MRLFTILFLAILFCSPNSSFAQTSTNALHFDGINDFVQIPNASGLLTGTSEISMSCWMKPENATPSFPDFDGIIGFRNELDFDFYILQLASNTTESRFRNSSGQIFTLTTPGLVLNDWNHYSLTYNGTTLKLYINGLASDSVAANGTISNANVHFNMGLLQFQVTDFFYMGALDEVTLWDKALTAEEANCIYKNEIDTLSPGLVLYYQFDQGKPGGNNTTILTLDDSQNTIDGVLSSFTLTGTTSNFIDGVMNFNEADTLLCEGSSISFGTQNITAVGEYSEVFQDSQGCDSTVYLTVLPAVDTSAKQNGFTITATVIGAQYQWVDCNNGYSIIPGETNQSYIATANGTYAVLITENGCTDTSNCFIISGMGIIENDIYNIIDLYPNPVSDKLFITIEGEISDVTISIINAVGQEVIPEFFAGSNTIEIETTGLPKGIYILHVCKMNKNASFRLVKE